uniref:hypothetical protein n=1 Tax=Limnohabitans sp. TaxID=1907725 RepID=UPI004047FFC1
MSQGGVPGGGVVKLRKQIPSVEVKFFDTTLSVSGVANVWQDLQPGLPLTFLSGIVQGTGPNQRIGRKIKVCGIILQHAWTQTDGAPWKIDVIRDKQCNGVQATAAQIYSVPNQFNGLPNPFEETRFQFVKRLQSFNPAQALGIATGTTQNVSIALKANFTVEYSGNTGGVGDLTSDNLLLFCSSPTAMTILNRGYLRILYTDA